jgi:hypothetical protein
MKSLRTFQSRTKLPNHPNGGLKSWGENI